MHEVRSEMGTGIEAPLRLRERRPVARRVATIPVDVTSTAALCCARGLLAPHPVVDPIGQQTKRQIGRNSGERTDKSVPQNLDQGSIGADAQVGDRFDGTGRRLSRAQTGLECCVQQ